MVASLLGGATLLFSCSGKKKPAEIDLEKLITQQSDTLTMIYTKNGQKDYRFSTPLMERYELAREPYMEFRYGINIITFDSLGNEASNLIADYAIYYENRELWEARGNVEGTGEDGRKLYTQQLFWDEKTDKVYSNVDCKVVDGLDVFVGEGFESDSEFKDWVFRESEGRMWVDVSENEDDGEKKSEPTKEESVELKPESVKADNKDKKDDNLRTSTFGAPGKDKPKPVFNRDSLGRRRPEMGGKLPPKRDGKPNFDGRRPAGGEMPTREGEMRRPNREAGKVPNMQKGDFVLPEKPKARE